MKPGIHPKYEETTVTCACGNTFTTRSTRNNLRIDVCSNCHPFYSGEQRMMDTAGQVDRFMRRLQSTQSKQAVASQRREQATAQPRKPSLYEEIYGSDEAKASQ